MPEKARLEITKGKREPKGLKDRGKVRLDCADCGRALMEFQIVRSNADIVKLDNSPGPVTTVVQANCGLCGGKSYRRTIEGQFHYGPADDALLCEYEENAPEGCGVAFKVRRKR